MDKFFSSHAWIISNASRQLAATQQAVRFGASIANTAGVIKIGSNKDSYPQIGSPKARQWGKKTVENRPLRSNYIRRFHSPTASQTTALARLGPESHPARQGDELTPVNEFHAPPPV